MFEITCIIEVIEGLEFRNRFKAVSINLKFVLNLLVKLVLRLRQCPYK